SYAHCTTDIHVRASLSPHCVALMAAVAAVATTAGMKAPLGVVEGVVLGLHGRGLALAALAGLRGIRDLRPARSLGLERGLDPRADRLVQLQVLAGVDVEPERGQQLVR